MEPTYTAQEATELLRECSNHTDLYTFWKQLLAEGSRYSLHELESINAIYEQRLDYFIKQS